MKHQPFCTSCCDAGDIHDFQIQEFNSGLYVPKVLLVNFTNGVRVCVRALPQAPSVQKKITLVQDALALINRTQFSVQELLKRPLPDRVNPLHLETYLSDHDFQVSH